MNSTSQGLAAHWAVEEVENRALLSSEVFAFFSPYQCAASMRKAHQNGHPTCWPWTSSDQSLLLPRSDDRGRLSADILSSVRAEELYWAPRSGLHTFFCVSDFWMALNHVDSNSNLFDFVSSLSNGERRHERNGMYWRMYEISHWQLSSKRRRE